MWQLESLIKKQNIKIPKLIFTTEYEEEIHMEISMNPYGTGACTISSDKYHKAYCCSAEHDWSVAIERLLSRPSFRVITSPYQLRVSDITEIKVFDGNRAMMVTIKTTDGEEK